ncbi:alpha/beta fold hydrolase [Roseateles violae]|uniref:Alpha/beta hydrolase n=1 Tax=Roseateles violae TaxID=3058042 RepID=A0ABT8DQY3_9BURK|nr:alpha/beta hydrolase [Pelomonas sp. PFR6]MDN3920769.1 alpha/beta hydrolase [Pelomonas sp. PFR6]
MLHRSDVVPSDDGVSIRYDLHGNGETTLIFVHGWCCDRHVWDCQADRLGASYRVVCLDLAGHGESGHDRKKFTVPAFAHDVIAVVRHLELKRVVLIGHSMAGGIIVEAARHLGAVVIGLVGVDTLWDVDKERSDDDVATFMIPFRADFAKAARGFVRSMFTATFDADRAEAIISAIVAVPALVGTEALESSMGNGRNLRAGLDEIRVPVALINSPHWQTTNVEGARRRGIDVKLLPGVGHFVMLDDSDALNQLLEGAVKRFVLASEYH